jgi:hypothetical protein
MRVAAAAIGATIALRSPGHAADDNARQQDTANAQPLTCLHVRVAPGDVRQANDGTIVIHNRGFYESIRRDKAEVVHTLLHGVRPIDVRLVAPDGVVIDPPAIQHSPTGNVDLHDLTSPIAFDLDCTAGNKP